VRRVCHRGLGVGADGFILVEPSSAADLRMIYYNRDGGAADLCGNGLRCVARWAARTGSFPRLMRIETGAGVLTADGAAEPPWFVLPLGAAVPERVTLAVGSRRVEGVRIEAGVPHLAIEVPDAFAVDVLDDAAALRSHEDLGPGGANLDYFTPRGGSRVDVRFYERGVEAETLSSGSGTIAVGVAASMLHAMTSPIVCRNREGLESRVTIAGEGASREATLAGEVRMLFRGRLVREMLA
jgi:diaminopimelate epimerase